MGDRENRERFELSNEFISKRPVPTTVAKEYWDNRMPRFGGRVYPTGARSWVVRYTPPGAPLGKRKFKTLGECNLMTCTKARIEAAAILSEVDQGIDPYPEAPEPVKSPEGVLTFGDLVDRFMQYAHEHKRDSSIRNDLGMIGRHLEEWKPRSAASITKGDVIAKRDEIFNSGSKIASNRVVVLISTIYNHALGDDLVEVNPAHKVRKLGKERSREHTLKPVEIKHLWGKLDAMPLPVQTFFKLGLLTGARAREILQMPNNELDFKKSHWTIPAGRNKSKRDHVVPLSPLAMRIIKAQIASNKTDHPYLFPSRATIPTPLCEYKKWMETVRVATGMVEPEGNPERFIFHSLRRTVATLMIEKGIAPKALVGKVLNHGEQGVTATNYDKSDSLKAKRGALLKWSMWLAKLCDAPDQNAQNVKAA